MMPLHKSGVTHRLWGLSKCSRCISARYIFVLFCVKYSVLLSSKNSTMLKVMLRSKGLQIGNKTAGKLLSQLDMSDRWMLPLLRIEESSRTGLALQG